ncbi:MAG: LAGLIDADG family homing endonuclease [Candidatus Woesearchaeota archaeon]|jgi:hypothetical protein|nr:LAGLIDADG family homing endonuclease [Candidatus Woesearchaeota archaeon]|tara:strand:+ start:104289 stop:105161 length:873 start_codon:yes stop_codon:yes gene_type:complete
MSTSQIGRIYNCNAETIRRYMIKFGIDRRKLHERKYKISKKQLENLYLKKRLSIIEIARKYGCSQWVIWSLLRYHRIRARGTNDYHSWKAPANQIKPSLEVTSTLAYVIGVILGDGWVYKRGYWYTIGLEALDKKFCESFYHALKQLKINPSIFHSRNYWRVVCSSKLFYIWFKSLDFNKIKEISEKYPIDFLRGFYESEGNFSTYKSKKYFFITYKITIVNTDKKLIDLVKFLLDRLGFHPTYHKRNQLKSNWKPLWALTLCRKLEVKQFIQLIKPCIKTGERRRSRNI